MIKWKVKGVYKADAEKVYSEIISIGETVTPESVVKLATDKKTELHKCFEWDDKKAAHAYRCHQAANIIRMIVVKADTPDEAPQEPIRCLVSIGGGTGAYTTINHIVRDDDQYQKLLRAAMQELNAFRNKYRKLAELSELIAAIDELL